MHDSIANYKLVVFDVDGTLYNQKRLRLFMLIELLAFYLFRPHKFYQLRALQHFRKEREKRALIIKDNVNIGLNQYKWCQEKTNLPLEQIQEIVERWIHQKPLKYLSFCRYNNVKQLLTRLRENNIKIAVFSDYKTGGKLEPLDLEVDHVFCSEQKEIGSLKPDPKGLNYIASRLNINKSNILYIGDREEMDGACAKNAGISYLNLDKKNAGDVFSKLLDELK